MRIIHVIYLKDYRLKLTFFNEQSLVFDFESFLKESTHPQIRQYLNKEKFKHCTIVTGFLSWDNGEMEISGEWVMSEYLKNRTPQKILTKLK